MHPLWKVLKAAKAQGVTADFKLNGKLWRALPYDTKHDKKGTVMVRRIDIKTGCYYDRSTLDCLVEPVGVDMGKDQLVN